MVNSKILQGPSSSVAQPTKAIKSRYDYTRVLDFVETKGKEIYGKKFRLLDEDHPIVVKLAAYFLLDEEICQHLEVSLHKGLMLTGPIGCGKTSLMRIMRELSVAETAFVMKSCREVTFEFIQDGYEVIHRYSKGHLYASCPRSYCFDDLGVENNIKYFGNECNVMAEVLLTRYDLFVSRGIKTHLTTNLSASELEDAYGNRLRSRLREMVNLVAFGKEVKDKRK